MRRSTASLVLASLGAMLPLAMPPPAHAHPVPDWEVRHVPRFPRELLAPWIQSSLPDSTGQLGRNRGGWWHVADQRPALVPLLIAAARGDEVMAERAWRAVDVAFAHQRSDGGFERLGAAPMGRADDAYGVSLWLGDLAHALLVLDQGPLRGWFGARSAALRPRVTAAGRWLAASSRDLERRDRRSAAALLVHADAFTLLGELDHDEKLLQLGQRFRARAMTLAGRDGRLIAPSDSWGEQGAALVRVQVLEVYYPSFEGALAAGRGTDWLIARLDGKQDVAKEWRTGRGRDGGQAPSTRAAIRRSPFGNPLDAGPRDIVLALLYRAELADDPSARAAAARASAIFDSH
jgi:hypothetical protein